MRILISCRSIGGMVGGQQRDAFLRIKYLQEHEIVLVAKKFLAGAMPEHPHLDVRLSDDYSPEGFFDLYMEFQGAPSFAQNSRATMKILIPGGDDVSGREHLFDRIAIEAPAGRKYFRDSTKALYLPPPYEPNVEATEFIARLPRQFFLTVMNPYSRMTPTPEGPKPYKGYDVLYNIASRSPHPIVWCHSDQSIDCHERIHDAPNIVHLHNATPGQIQFLYDQALAYICFSRDEGYGWAIADALARGTPVISRDIGVLTMFEHVHGIYRYETEEQLLKWLYLGLYERSRCDLGKLHPSLFVQRLEAALRIPA